MPIHRLGATLLASSIIQRNAKTNEIKVQSKNSLDKKLTLKKRLNILKIDQFSITKFEDEYFICSHQFNDIKETNLVSEIATCFLKKINGILRLKFGGFKCNGFRLTIYF